MRRTVLASISCTYFSWVASRPALRPLAFSDESRLPFWSITLTLAAGRCGTLEATMWAMPATWFGSRLRPGWMLSTTEAEGFCSSRMKPVCFGMARCTRAPATAASDWMERDSSPSSARWKLICSMNCDMPSFWFSISSKPTRPPLGRPCEARRMRSSCTCCCGTRMAPPDSENLKGTFICCSAAMMLPPSRSEMFVNSTAKVGVRVQVQPATTIAATMDRAMMVSSFCCMGSRMKAASENCVSAIYNHRSFEFAGSGPGHLAAFCPCHARSVLEISGNFCLLFAGLAGLPRA